MKKKASASILGIGSLAVIAIVANGCDGSGFSESADGGDAGSTIDASPTTDGGSDSGTVGPLGFNPTNYSHGAVDELANALAAPDLGDVVLDDCGPSVSNDSVNGRLGCDAPGTNYKRIVGFKGGVAYVAKNIRIPADKILAVGGDGSEHVVLVAKEKIEILGGVNVVEGKSGGADQGGGASKDGSGPGAGKGTSNSTSGSGGGGGFCGKGGNAGQMPGGEGGPSYGNAELKPVVGGSSGGALLPGVGGGAIELVAGAEIVVAATGFVDARGGGHGGGGGSGGAILMEAAVVKIEGTVTANGGGGGGTGGQDGKPGERTSTPASGGIIAGNVPGGNGGAGTAIDGTAGATNTGSVDGTGSASGGGAAGRIRINTRSGAATISGLVSPALTSVCATQGSLR